MFGIDNKVIDLQNGFNTAFINQTFQSNLAYRPQFIYNDNKNGQKVFSSIEEELLHCDSFPSAWPSSRGAVLRRYCRL